MAKAKLPKPRTITADYVVSDYIDLHRVLELPDGRRVQVRIHCDSSYPRQSKAVVELWTTDGWRPVHQPHPLTFRELWEKSSPYSREPHAVRAQLEALGDQILKVALDILTPPGAPS
ncbi:MAG: hypothetical protein BWY85_00128 [Firmicutes bacterium ADurb.Bin506]|nr:MAG: hypothetical protein BWY85_00128 [Firmicutes bacterium ADurb.Bin506]